MQSSKRKLRDAVSELCSRGCATIDAYTHLVLECLRSKDVDQARRLQTHMELHVFRPPTTFIHNRLLHLYARSGKLADAGHLFDKMPQRDIISWNTLLSAYSNWGSLEDLQAVFDQMPQRDSVSYNTVIAGLSGKGCSGKALELFVSMQREGFPPTAYTHVSALNACSQLLDLKRGKQIHGRIASGCVQGNVFVWNALADLYAKCGNIDQARRLFDCRGDKNAVSWNSMISGYLRNGQPKKCIELFHEMLTSALKPDGVTLSSVLGAYFQVGDFDGARSIFKVIKEKDVVCWTSMIVGFAQNGKEEEALVVFKEMQAENVKPDSFTISALVSSCAKLASLCHGQVIHGIASRVGVDLGLLVSSALVDMYCKCGETADAMFAFKMMPLRNVISWNSMIVGFAQNGQDSEALALYEEMLQENFKPDPVTYVAILSACVHGSLIDRGQDYFDSISNVYGMTPTLDHYACMINLLGRAGQMDKAMNLIKSLPHEPNCLIWSTLLSVSKLNGDIAHAEMAAKHLFELDPLSAGPYIMLSNMYAACKRWKDVAYMRSLMKENKVKKLAAYSWIEIDNKVHKFVAEDRTHPETRLIYDELGRLITELQKSGFIPNTDMVLHDIREDEKLKSICFHSEKLALAYALTKKPDLSMPIRIMKNIRVCDDCHRFMKVVSKVTNRYIILRDTNRFHHFNGGKCSCKDYW